MATKTEASDRRGGIWVDWRFQVWHTIRMVGIALALIVVLFAMYVRALDEQSRLLGLTREGAAPAGEVATPDESAAFDADLRDRVRMEDRQHLLGLAVAALGLVALLTALAIRVTFRLAGPVHAVSGMMHAMASGDFRALRRLRRRDEFRQLEDGVFAVHAAWGRMAVEDAALLARVAAALRARPSGAGQGDPEAEALAAEAEALARRRNDEFGEI
ncbi:MAG TPA: hypothetical protein PK313_15425 [Myxococcota bacterium]|nr:hypothetical protein [Myxococcota bacterium]